MKEINFKFKLGLPNQKDQKFSIVFLLALRDCYYTMS